MSITDIAPEDLQHLLSEFFDAIQNLWSAVTADGREVTQTTLLGTEGNMHTIRLAGDPTSMLVISDHGDSTVAFQMSSFTIHQEEPDRG